MDISVYQFAPHELEDTLNVLDTAIANHRKWFDKLHTSMLCSQPFPDDILNKAAHTCCQFGRWYYSDNVNPTIRSFNDFIKLEDVHRHMHDNARELARLSQQDCDIPADLYQTFLQDQRTLIRLLNSLHDQLLEHQHCFDSLTGAVNRRSISLLLENVFENARRYEAGYCVVMLDADHFKKINDEFGHLVGDHVLKHIASCLKCVLRKSDCLGRYGGEEFLIVLPKTDTKQAFQTMDKCRSSLAEIPIVIADQKLHVTISIGISEFNAHDEDAWQAVKRADLALYKAKESGRNKVEKH